MIHNYKDLDVWKRSIAFTTLETHLIVGCNLTFLTQDELGVASKAIEETGKMLNGLIGALKSRTEAA